MRIEDLRAVRPHLVDPVRVILAKRYAAQKDILNWGRILFPDKFELSFCKDLHGYLIATRGFERKATEAPRNHAKTTIECFLIPIFQALEEPESFNHYLNVQSTGTKAISVNVSIKIEIESNILLREVYGDQVGTDKWTDQQFVFKNGVIFTSIGAGQSIRGLNYRNTRPDFIIVDDLYDEDDINNMESTEKKTKWFWGSLYPARAKSRRCAIHIQGTAINTWDLLEKMKKMDRWTFKTFRSIIDEDAKVVLWPDLNTWESLQQDKHDMGSIIFNREMQNERLDEKESKVKRAWLKDWEFDPSWLRNELQVGKNLRTLAVIVGNDPSIGKDTESDDTGTAVVMKTGYTDSTRVDYWIMDLRAEKLSLEGRKDQLEQIAAAQMPTEKVTAVKIEAIGAFDDYASHVTNKTNLPVERVSWVRDKLSNLENKSHHFENGRVHVSKNIGATSDGRDLKEMLIHQLTTNYPQHDDVRDSVLLTLDDDSGLWRW